MTKIQQMIELGIPVVENRSDEVNGTYVFEAMTDEKKETLNIILGGWDVIRANRNGRIESIRWMLDEGVPISLTKRTEVLDYIQKLRDIPQDFTDPLLVVWPEAPKYETI